MKFNYFLIVCFLIQFKLYTTGRQHKFPRQIDAQPEMIYDFYIFNPLSLKDLAYNFLDTIFKQASPDDQRILLAKINDELPCELIEEFADQCLDSFCEKQDLPFSNEQQFQISDNHDYFCTYQVPSLNKHLDVSVRRMATISMYCCSEMLYSSVYYGILLCEVALSPSGKYYSFIMYDNDSINVKIHNTDTKETNIVKKYTYDASTATIRFHDENTLVGFVGKDIFIYKIDTKNMNTIDDLHPCENFDDIVIMQDHFLLYRRVNEATAIVLYDLQRSNIVKTVDHRTSILHLKKINDQTVITADSRELIIWHLDGEHLKKERKIRLSGITGLALDPSHSLIFVNCEAQPHLSIWELDTGNLLYEIVSNRKCQYCSWDLDNKEILLKGREHNSHVLYAYSPKNLRLGLTLKKSLIKKMQLAYTNSTLEEAINQ